MSAPPPLDEAARSQMSLEALARGDLPISAQERIARQAAKPGGFTSDLSVNEFLAIKEAGFEAVSQVMGSSVYQIAWTSACTAMGGSQGMWAITEMYPYAQAMTDARNLALGRMQKEAAGVGGHGVVGVRLTWRYLGGERQFMEFTAIGTAIRRPKAPTLPRPFLSSLSGQEFAKLYRAGYMPCGLAIGITACQIHTGWGRSLVSSWNNQEIGQYTSAVATARHAAMGRLYEQLKQLGADGCVGATVGLAVSEQRCYYSNWRGEQEELEDKVVQFHAIGTAVVRFSTETDVRPIRMVRRLDDFTSQNVEVDV